MTNYMDKLRALREGGVKDRILLLVIGSLSIWFLSWSFETGTGLIKDEMARMDGPRPASIPTRPKELSFRDVEYEHLLQIVNHPTKEEMQERVRRSAGEVRRWEDEWGNAPSRLDWDKRRASRNDNLLLNPRKRWPHYGLIQEWSGKVGLLLVGLWLLAWVLTSKKQNELTE